MKNILALLLCFGLIGCATAPIHTKDVMTEIISDPPGAKIEIENQYVGETPLTLHIKRTREDFFWNGFLITATPTQTGQYVQRKYVAYDEPTPTRVYFNMYLTKVTPEYNYNINIQNK